MVCRGGTPSPAGAKVVDILRGYEKSQNISRFDNAVDWGWFWFLTQPLFWLLDIFSKFIGNFGIAILMLTVVVKLLFFPLANASFKSMSRMKKVQPLMEEIKKRHKEDAQRQQQEIMEMYKREKVNPLTGCLPMLIQIPVFFSLYKVLFVTIEMRQAPFYGWIHDLSAPDPTSILNLFGLLPYHIPAFIPAYLSIGIWPILMGVTQFVQTKLNPAPGPQVGVFPARLGWAPVWDARTAVRETASWYREYYRAAATAHRLVEHQLRTYQDDARAAGLLWAAEKGRSTK